MPLIESKSEAIKSYFSNIKFVAAAADHKKSSHNDRIAENLAFSLFSLFRDLRSFFSTVFSPRRSSRNRKSQKTPAAEFLKYLLG